MDTILNRCYAAFLYDTIEEYNHYISAILKALKTNAHNIPALNNLGVLYWEIGEMEFAAEYLERACHLNSMYSQAFDNFARFRRRYDDHASALDLYREALKIDAKRTTTHAALANIYFEMEDYENAVQHFAYVTQYSKVDYNGKKAAAYAYGKRADALEKLDRLVEAEMDRNNAKLLSSN